jgi:polyprenyl-phospho-N-acetylgalactosaminyl synthase
MSPNNIVFLIRAYNEASRILSVIEGIFAAGYREILVVDDGSTDGTRELLSELIWEKEDKENQKQESSVTSWQLLSKGAPKIHYVHHVTNRGAGAALETGFAYIRQNASKNNWTHLVTFDADGQHDIADIDKYITAFAKDPKLDIVFGSRFIIKTNTNVPFFRRLILWGGRVFTSLISWVHLTDAHNGYRMMRVDALDHIKITMDGMEYASELIDQVGSHALRFTEVPVNIHYDAYTLGKWQRFGWPLRIVIRMLFKKFF